MSKLPSDPKLRKSVPIFSGVIRYFPDALAAVAELSRIGSDQHSPGKPLHWDRSKSGDELDALARHLIDAGTLDADGVRHSAKVAWRALANLQKEIERESTQAAGRTVGTTEFRSHDERCSLPGCPYCPPANTRAPSWADVPEADRAALLGRSNGDTHCED
jgi:hypothetical protein